MASRTITSLLLLLVLGAKNAWADCATTASVATTIQNAVNAIPAVLTGDYCIYVPQSAYGEQVTIVNKDTAGYRIYITSQAGTDPIIDPPGGATAGFVVQVPSVTIIGMRINDSNAPAYSVLASSSGAELRSIAAASPVYITTGSLMFDVTGPMLISDGDSSTLDASSSPAVFIHGDVNVLTTVFAGSITVTGASVDITDLNAGFGRFTGYGPFAQTSAVSTMSIAADDANFDTVSFSSLTIAGNGAIFSTLSVGSGAVTGDFSQFFGVSGGTLSVSGAGSLLQNLSLTGVLSVSSGAGSIVQDSLLRTVNLGPNADQGRILRSTATFVRLDRSQQPVLAYSYVQGSTTVVVSGSTGAVVQSNRLFPGVSGNGVAVTSGAYSVRITSNAIFGGKGGVYFDKGNDGPLVVGTNTLSGGNYGLLAAQQAPLASLSVTSNTVTPAIVPGGNSYGLHFDGLTGPTTVYNNSVYHSVPLSMAGGAAYLLYAKNLTALTVSHNRFNSPNMTSVGNLLGLYLENSPNAEVTRNDGFLQASPVSSSYMLQLFAGSVNALVQDNIFVMGVGGTSTGTVNVDAGSLSGMNSDYNDFHALTGRPSAIASGSRHYFPSAWRSAISRDLNSIAADPDWVSTSGAGDFHPRSQGGRWDPSLPGFVNDAVTSPTIGRGSTSDMGSYAGTAEASLPFVDLPSGCFDGFNVKLDGSRDFASIQDAVDSFPKSPAGDFCAVVRDTATYSGSLAVDGFTQAFNVRLKIMADPSFVSSAPVVSSLFVRTSSVTIERLIVRPTAALPVAVNASSMNVVLTTVTVDAGGFVTQVGVRVSSMSQVVYSSVAVANAVALQSEGLGNRLSDTWLSANTPFSALRLGGGGLSSDGPLQLRGTVDLADGVWSAGPYEHQITGDLMIPASGSFAHQNSTLTFNGGQSVHQRIVPAVAGGSFGHLQVDAASGTFTRGFSALSFSHRPSTFGVLTFANGQTFSFGELTLHGNWPSTRTLLTSDLNGAAWSMNVGRSSITAVQLRDTASNSLIHANDGKSLQLTNVANVNFAPFLSTLLPGETWVNQTGKTGAPSNQTAGAPFDVTILSYDSSSNTIFTPTFVSSVVWTELWVSTPPGQPLAAGATVFSNVVLRTAQSTVITPRASAAFRVQGSTVTVDPGAPARMQVLLTGEDPVPGSPAGKSGVPEVVAQGVPSLVTVRQTDFFWNLVNAADAVELTTAAPLASNLPQQAALVAGATVFNNVVFLATGSVQLYANDLTPPFVAGDTSTVLVIFTAQTASPTLSIAIPDGSIRATIGGELAGTAADGVAVSRVSVAVRRLSDDAWYDWLPANFTAASPVFGLATVTPPLGQAAAWAIALPDAKLTDGTSYFIVARATNPSTNITITGATFTYTLGGLVAGSGADGAGSLSVLPASAVGCETGVSTLTYTAGPAGMAAGGVLAIRLPDGWTRPVSTTAVNPPAVSGEVRVAPPDAWVELNPPSLGDGWIAVSTPLAAGGSVQVTVRAFRPSAGSAVPFSALSRGAAIGQLRPLASFPTETLSPGTTQHLVFSPSTPLTLGPLQVSPTMQLVLTDACGTPTVAPVNFQITMSVSGDPNSIFYSTGGTINGARTASMPATTGSSSRFYFRASTSAFSLVATTTGALTGVRDLRMLASTMTVTGVSVDTGTLMPGVLVATMTADPNAYPAYVNFTVPDDVPWEVLITTAPNGSAALARRSGFGPPGRSVTWAALDERSSPSRAVNPGDYWARIEAGGAVAVSSSARVHVDTAAVPSIFGSLGLSGASGLVTAAGPGAGPGSFAVANSSGFFQVFGLLAGTTYELRAASAALVWTATSAVAQLGGVDVGTLTLPTNGRLRLSVGLPLSVPRELWGQALVYDSTFTRSALATLHFTSGSSVSDDGAQGFGAAGSTWSIVSLPPGSYSLQLDLAELNLSTRAAGLALTAGGTLDLKLTLGRKARAAGQVRLPAAPSSPVAVSLQAGPARGQVVVSGSSVALFSLFGLDAGTHTVTASAPGHRPAQAQVLISTSLFDAAGLDLTLSTHGVITGTVTAAGALVEAYHPATGGRSRAQLEAWVSTFTLTGLADGLWELSAALPGYVTARASAAAGGSVQLGLFPQDAWTAVNVRLPGASQPASEFRRVALRAGDVIKHDIIAGATVQYFTSSATVRVGGLPTGRVEFTALYAGTNALARGSALLTQGATQPLSLDLSASTYAVRGSVAVNGAVHYSSAGFSVSVSSIAGLLSQSATGHHCLLGGSTTPVSALGFHVELVPLAAGQSTAPELIRSTGCSGDVSTAYLAPVNADGSFQLQAPAGLYVLRSGGDLDGDPRNGLELPVESRLVSVTTADVSGLQLRLGGGRTISGRVSGFNGARSFIVALLDQSGAVVRASAASPEYALRGVPPGDYTLRVEDVGSPRAYALRPRPLEVINDLSLDLAVEPAGQIQGRLALEAPASSAVVVTAMASPWFHGGEYAATLSGDRFVVDGLPAGLYELRAVPEDGRFAVGSLPGVSVAAGQVTEAGALVVPLSREVRGLVTGNGAPAPGVPVEAAPSFRVPGGPPVVRTLTGPDGRYALTGLDPRARWYDITAAGRPDAPWQARTAAGVDVTSAAAVDFSLSSALSTVRGRVSPAAGRVSLKRVGEQRELSAPTEHDGAFALISVATGVYRLTASAEGYASLTRLISVQAQSVDVGTMTLARGATLSGRLLKADGSSPSYDEVARLAAATPDLSEILSGELSADNAEYEVSGFRAGRAYRLLLVGRSGEVRAAGDVTFSTTTESRRLDLIYRAPRPAVLAKARRSGAAFELTFDVTQPLRSRTSEDSALAAVLSTFSATGALSQLSLQDGRTRLTALYTPGVSESSFTLRFAGYTTALDPDSLDPRNPEHLVVSTVAFFTGVDGVHRSEISNLSGGVVGVEGDNGRVTLPPGAFGVDASSSVQVTVQVAGGLRLGAAAYPNGLMKAMAAAPPDVSPFSPFYEVLLPLGVRTTLSRPAPLSVSYSTGADVSKLNLYWYNAAANSYVLQQDVTGAQPVIDPVNRTVTVNVDHFSTFVLFEANVNVIGGTVFGGGGIEAYNFPNPFDLKEKTVTTIHGGGSPVVRGTMIRVALPAGVSGGASIRVFNVAGERVRTLDLGNLSGGQHYYQSWDGRNDSGRDVASGVYIGVLNVGKTTKSFKMAVIK